MTSFESYQSPFSWRYGSPEMRAIWGEENKRLMWRKLWVTMAEAQTAWNLVTAEQVQDLKDHMHDVDVSRALELEKINHHDLMAEIKVFAEQCPLGGGILHMGATSMDIKDNAEVLQMVQSLELLLVARPFKEHEFFAGERRREANHAPQGVANPVSQRVVGNQLAPLHDNHDGYHRGEDQDGEKEQGHTVRHGGHGSRVTLFGPGYSCRPCA